MKWSVLQPLDWLKCTFRSFSLLAITLAATIPYRLNSPSHMIYEEASCVSLHILYQARSVAHPTPTYFQFRGDRKCPVLLCVLHSTPSDGPVLAGSPLFAKQQRINFMPGMPSSALASTGSPPMQSLSCPVRRNHNDHGTVGQGKNRGDGGGASATDATLALSKQPVLSSFRSGLAPALAILFIIVNVATLVSAVYYFRTSCTNEYGVLPNESGDFIPPSLANLANQAGVTIISRSLVYYQANNTVTQEGLNFWTPFERTCGCSECNLASCSATIPIVVEYEQCNPWTEVSRCKP